MCEFVCVRERENVMEMEQSRSDDEMMMMDMTGGESVSGQMGMMGMYFTTGTMVTVWFESWMTKTTTAYGLALFGLAAFGVVHEWLTSVRMKLKVRVQCIKMEMHVEAGRARERETVLQTTTTLTQTIEKTDVENVGDSEMGGGRREPQEERWLLGKERRSGGGDGAVSGMVTEGSLGGGLTKSGSGMRRNLIAHEAGVSMLYMLNLIFSYLLMLAVMSYNIGVFFAVILGMTLGHFAFNASPQVPSGQPESPDCRYRVGQHVFVDGNSSGDTCHPQT